MAKRDTPITSLDERRRRLQPEEPRKPTPRDFARAVRIRHAAETMIRALRSLEGPDEYTEAWMLTMRAFGPGKEPAR